MEEILREIAEAEEKANTIKQNAVERASVITARAEAEAAALLKNAEEECALTRERGIANAAQYAEKQYEAALTQSRREAAGYADKISAASQKEADEIVGRICRGSR